MKVKVLLLFFLPGFFLFTACSSQEAEEAEVPFQTYTIDQFLKTTSIGGGYFNADESRLLVHSNETGIFNASSIEISTGEKTPLTKSETESVFAMGYMPNSDTILYTSDKGGNEINHLFLQDTEGELRELTEGEETKEMFYGFAHDLQSFFTGNNGRDARFMDVYEWDLETLNPKLIYTNEDGLDFSGMSRDKRWMTLQRTHNDFDSDLYLVDRDGKGDPKLISIEEGEINHYSAAFTPDNSTLLYLTDKDSDWLYLMSYDLETAEQAEVFRPEKWDVSYVSYSYNGKYRVLGVNENAVTRLIITIVETGEQLELPNLPEGDVTGINFSRSEKLMRFYLVNDDAPANLFLYNLETGDLKQLTDNLNPEIQAGHLVSSELVTMQARDGLEFYGYLYKPVQAAPENRVPALLMIHGGPGGQSRPVYSGQKQFMVNHGYAIFDLNYRGSSGFGRTFSMADDQKHGKEPLWDCVDAKDWLKANADWIDPDKIGIMGGSYGGYMVMAALAYEPEEFAVGVNLFGVTNWVRTLKSIPPWWESFKYALYRELGNPETQEDMLREISPLFHAEKITKPVIILQGANDPRVLQVESDEMVEAVREKGGIAEYVLFDDEGHGFSKTANQISGWNAVLEFTGKYLKAETE
ncbi:MAG: S9 family peptidase [Acidobacteriota bacterium]